jgi:hypothetical protein
MNYFRSSFQVNRTGPWMDPNGLRLLPPFAHISPPCILTGYKSLCVYILNKNIPSILQFFYICRVLVKNKLASNEN